MPIKLSPFGSRFECSHSQYEWFKIQNNADINSFVRTHHPRAVIYAELYFLYFIFLTVFSGAALCVAPASASLAVEYLLPIFILLFNWMQCYFLVKDGHGAVTSMIPQPALLNVGLRWKRRCCSTLQEARQSYTIYCYNPSAHIIIM